MPGKFSARRHKMQGGKFAAFAPETALDARLAQLRLESPVDAN